MDHPLIFDSIITHVYPSKLQKYEYLFVRFSPYTGMVPVGFCVRQWKKSRNNLLWDCKKTKSMLRHIFI